MFSFFGNNETEKLEFEIKNETPLTIDDYQNATSWYFSNDNSGEMIEDEKDLLGEDVEKRIAVTYEELMILKKEIDNYIGSQGQILSKANGKSGTGSGKLFYDFKQTYPNTQFVITCAHNFILTDKETGTSYNAESSEFSFRKSLNSNNEPESDAVSKIRKFHIYKKYNTNSDYNDIAIGVLEENMKCHIIENKNVFIKGFHEIESSMQEKTPIYLVGYPGEYKGKLYYMQGTIQEIIKNNDDEIIITYKDIVTTRGQSGSPVYLRHNNKWIQFGIHKGYSKKHKANVAIVLTKEKIDWIETVTSRYYNPPYQ